MSARLLRYLVNGAAALTLGSLALVVGYILVRGIPHLRPELFEFEYTTQNVSMLPAIVNTLIMTAVSLLIALPLGVFAAIFLVEYARLFGVTPDAAVSGHYMALTRDLSVHGAVKLALSSSTAGARLERGGRIYQLLANPVLVEEAASGAILLLLDVTEREQAEETRREFSANVSHELKTPLTSIAGYAEMLAAGMIESKDVPDAAGKIHAEARRMIALIEDILALSKLDEGQAPAQKEQVELLPLARDVAALLAAAADAQGVSVAVEGEPAAVLGVRSVLEEMLFNLVENSIKYNKPGGKVRVSVVRTGEGVAVTVADTGVGIAPEHQERVFERFYRVDKSHSRSTGGTGLGLSIVKHGAMLHGAKVTLKSEDGEGTEVQVVFLQ